jgi:serine/threonine-protein kinase PpkA
MGWSRGIHGSAAAVNITIPGYKIEHIIAEGGTSSVYLAIQESLQRHVAIKLLRKFDNPEQLTRFLNEGQIIASLNHRNVINIHDIGVTDGGRPYITMEYLEGGDLDARIPNKVDPKDALRWLEAIGNCLEFVHRKGIIHRDIKPGNILFHKDGTPILTDFGTAKQQESDAKLTLEGFALGSPYYISPEQATSKKLDGRTDIYSLGVVLYEMLTGNKPYKRDSHIETIAAHLSEPIPDLPPELVRYHTLIKKMMAKSPDDRFACAAEMVRVVQQLRKAVNQARRMTWIPTGTAASAMDMLHVVRQLPETVRRSASMARLSTAAAGFTTAVVSYTRQIRLPIKNAQPTTWVFAAAVAAILGIGGTLLLRPSITPDYNTPQTTAGMTVSHGAVAEGSPDTLATRVHEPGDSVPETAATADRNAHQTPPDMTTSEGAAPASAAVITAAPSEELTAPVKEAPSPANTHEQRIANLLSRAATAVKEYRLTTPKQNNAFDYYQQVLEVQPRHKQALKGINSIADAYADLAEKKLGQFDYTAAGMYVQRGLTIQPDNSRLLALQKKADIRTILAQAGTALKQHRLTEPKNDNAYDYYKQVLELQPQHKKALEGITSIANAYADLAEAKLDKFDYEAAKAYVNKGLTVQPGNTRLLALQKNTNAFRDAPKRVWKKIFSSFSKAE